MYTYSFLTAYVIIKNHFFNSSNNDEESTYFLVYSSVYNGFVWRCKKLLAKKHIHVKMSPNYVMKNYVKNQSFKQLAVLNIRQLKNQHFKSNKVYLTVSYYVLFDKSQKTYSCWNMLNDCVLTINCLINNRPFKCYEFVRHTRFLFIKIC